MAGLLKLHGTVQNYDWGIKGSASAVAQLAAAASGSVVVDELRPYAELWFGTHPSGPSRVSAPEGEVLLAGWLASHPEAQGRAPDVAGALPYLLKVLSVAKALSVQAHPDKVLAAKLHAERPTIYKDPNHKPEMACAVTGEA